MTLKKITLWFDPDLSQKLKKIAANEYEHTPSSIIRQMVRYGIQHWNAIRKYK